MFERFRASKCLTCNLFQRNLFSLHLNLQLQEDRAEAVEQRQADEARHAREVATITRQFEEQAEELRAEINASRTIEEHGDSAGGVEVDAQQGEEDEQETMVGGSVAEGEFNEEDGGNDSDGETDVGNFDSPDFSSRRSLV